MTAHHAHSCPDCGEPYPDDGTTNPCAQPSCVSSRERRARSRKNDAERHALATTRTPSRLYPDRTPVCVDGMRGPNEVFDDIEDARRAIVNAYRQEHRDAWPPDGWVPDAFVFGITSSKHSFTADHIAEYIVEHVQEDAYEDWEIKPSQRAELIRRLGPVVEVLDDLDLGYTQDLSHAVDLDAEDIAATIRQMKREEAKP